MKIEDVEDSCRDMKIADVADGALTNAVELRDGRLAAATFLKEFISMHELSLHEFTTP